MDATKAAARLVTPRFALVVMVGLAYFLSLGMMLPVVPVFVTTELHGGDVAVGVVVGAFAVGSVLIRPVAGLLGDRFGRRALIVSGAAIVGLSASLYHLTSSPAPLVAVRLLGGIGEAAFFVGAGTMVADLAPPGRRGEAISYWSVAVYGGLAFGPFLGEYLMGELGFTAVWYVASGLAALAAVTGIFTTETMPPDNRAASGGRRPKLFHRSSLTAGFVLFLGMIGMAGFFAFVPLYVTDIGLTQARSVFLVYGCVVLAIRIFGARLPDALGSLRAGTAATGLSAAGLVILGAIPNPVGLFCGAIVFACGISLLYPAMLNLALGFAHESERGSSVGTVSSFFDLSQGLGAVILGAVAAVAGYRGVFVAGAAFALGGLMLLRGRGARSAAGGATTGVSDRGEPVW